MSLRMIALSASMVLLTTTQALANPPVQHAPAPDRGAAGSGSMGIGEGIHHGNQPSAGETGETGDFELPERHPRQQENGDGHGDHDTDMEHRRRD